MEDLILKRISGLITHHSGIYIRDQDYRLLSEKVWQRAKILGLTSLNDYHDYLLKELEKTIAASKDGGQGAEPGGNRSEWQELYSILTINESYFFRDSNQFKLLTDRLLPDLISRNQAQAESSTALATKPRLRIWSAGCSTGEELYSIAIALTELGFDWDRWDAQLVGTDISMAAIESARRGIYSNWSFRQIPPAIQQKYFDSHHQLYKICDSIQRRVVFRCGNLLNDRVPNPASGLCDLDLIFCRNVFIYLDSHAIGQIIQKFHSALVPQGYLLTGHTELYSQDISQFQTLSFPESVVYKKPLWSEKTTSLGRVEPAQQLSPQQLSPQRLTAQRLEPKRRATATRGNTVHHHGQRLRSHVPHSKPATPNPDSDRNPGLQQALQAAEALLHQRAYASAIQQAQSIYTAHPHCDAARKIAAQAYANSGLYDQAKQLCNQVLSRHPLSVDMHYLLAQIAEDQNDLETTKDHLRKIIYLDASYVKAYLDLASIYELEKQPDKTQKMHSHALSLLGKLPPDAVLDATSTTTIAEWKDYLEKKILARDKSSLG